MGIRLEKALARGGCVHFERCGGCQFQHGSYTAQIRLKATTLKCLLTSAGLTDLPSIETHTAEPYGYRNRIRLRIATLDGAIRVGYSRAGTNDFLPIVMCPIAATLLWRAAASLVQLAAEDALCRRWLGAATEVELFCTGAEERLQLTLFLQDAEIARQESEKFAGFCTRLQALVPELVGAGVRLDPELSRRRRRAWDGEDWGAAGLMYPVAEKSYWVSRGAFFQVNRFLVDRLVALVTDGRSGGLAWDLFAGVGLFSQALATGFANVIAVEGGEVAAKDLAQLARKSGGKIDAVRAPTVDFLQRQVLQRVRPELVVMDPPRAGVGPEGCGLLVRLRVPALVYVSCDPATLARDLKVLAAGGYRIEAVSMIDLFPQTAHLETVVSLRHTG